MYSKINILYISTMTLHQTFGLGCVILPWRVALAFALAAATATATRAFHADIGGIVLALAIIPLGIVVASITSLASFKFWAFLHVGEDVVAAIIWGDEAEALVLEELLDCSSGRHACEIISRYRAFADGLTL